MLETMQPSFTTPSDCQLVDRRDQLRGRMRHPSAEMGGAAAHLTLASFFRRRRRRTRSVVINS